MVAMVVPYLGIYFLRVIVVLSESDNIYEKSVLLYSVNSAVSRFCRRDETIAEDKRFQYKQKTFVKQFNE